MGGTILASIIIMAVAILALAIGWFITGKNRCRSSCNGLGSLNQEKDSTCTGDKLSCALCDKKNTH
jgi:hypothetical protein